MNDYMEQPEPEQPGPRMSFDIRVESFDTSRFYADIVDRAVERMLGQSWQPSQIAKTVQGAVSAEVARRLDGILEEAVAGLLSKPIQKFDTFGSPVGDPISVESLIRDGATAFLTETVDSQGRASRDAFGDKKTRLARIVENAVITGLRKDMEQEAGRVREQLVKHASDAAAAVLTEIGRRR